jgi:hypothetical protein
MLPKADIQAKLSVARKSSLEFRLRGNAEVHDRASKNKTPAVTQAGVLD